MLAELVLKTQTHVARGGKPKDFDFEARENPSSVLPKNMIVFYFVSFSLKFRRGRDRLLHFFKHKILANSIISKMNKCQIWPCFPYT